MNLKKIISNKKLSPIIITISFCFAIILFSQFPSAPPQKEKIKQETFTVKSNPELRNQKYKLIAKRHKTNKRVILYLPNSAPKPNYQDTIKLSGKTIFPDPPTNPGQFDYPKYLRTQKISGVISAKKWQKTASSYHPIKTIHKLRAHLLRNFKKTLPEPYDSRLAAFIFGDNGIELDEDWQTNFQDLGLIHLLVVSGSQVALISGIVLSTLKQSGISPRLTMSILTLINVSFFILTGGGPSVLRAIIMLQLTETIHLMQRKVPILHIISLTLLVMLLMNPMSLFDPGAQLSYMATISLILLAPLIAPYMPGPQSIKQLSAIAIAPFIMTLPLTWTYFYTITPIALISNFLIISVVEFLVVLGFFSTLIGIIFPFMMQLINETAYLILVFLDQFISLLSKIPIKNIYITPPPLWGMGLIYAVLFYGINLFQSKKWNALKKLSAISAVSIVLALILSILPQAFKITYLDVGQGDATLIETPNHHTILIDTGKYKNRLSSTLKYKGINKIDTLIITHYDIDHSGALEELIKTFKIGTLIHNGRRPTSLSEKIPNKHITIPIEKNITLDIYYPMKGIPNESDNNNSLAIKLTHNNTTYLWTGDLETDGEAALIEEFREEIDIDVLQAGHHGSKTSSTKEFLKATTPKAIIISCGRNNRFGHPHPTVINRYKQNKIPYSRTDLQGAIVFPEQAKIQ